MGWHPAIVYSTTVPDFWAAWEGWSKIHLPQPDIEPMTRVELHDLIRQEREFNERRARATSNPP